MSEQELKFYVPESSRAKLEQALRRGAVTQTRLRALYFDNPLRELASQKIALRLRLEGQQWVQTLKMPGDKLISRLEFNHERSVPELDLSVYKGTQAAKVFDDLTQPLLIRFDTQVLRPLRLQRVPGGSVEIAFDLAWFVDSKSAHVRAIRDAIHLDAVLGRARHVHLIGRRHGANSVRMRGACGAVAPPPAPSITVSGTFDAATGPSSIVSWRASSDASHGTERWSLHDDESRLVESLRRAGDGGDACRGRARGMRAAR
jgi:hypothetical protein